MSYDRVLVEPCQELGHELQLSMSRDVNRVLAGA